MSRSSCWGRGSPSCLLHGGGRHLADAFEAFVAALYGLRGIEAAADFVLSHVAERERIGGQLADPKTVLQEWTQKRAGVLPAYHDRFEGPAHERTFFAEVTVDGERAQGNGPSKKAAQRAAAAAALARLEERYGAPDAPAFSRAIAPAKTLARGASKRKRP